MKFALLQYTNEAASMAMPREEMGKAYAAYQAYTEALKQAGVYVDSAGLRPTAEATTVRAPGGTVSVLDGPFAETKEQFNGYYLIDVADLDAALVWAKRHPAVAFGAIEIRPMWG